MNLEEVLEREEHCGLLVPVLVKRCIDEVERRGMDIIGIYRLCGADTKKSILRMAFEEDPEAVDLTSENVPDINVITGRCYILRDEKSFLWVLVLVSCVYFNAAHRKLK